MPYRNIHFTKLEKRLLNDPRFFLMSEKSQLTYIKLLLVAAHTDNKIPTNTETLRQVFRSKLSRSEIAKCIKEIRRKFPKFKKSRTNYYFEEWENRVNWRQQGTPKELPRNSQGVPKEATDKEEDKDKEEEKRDVSSFNKKTKRFYKPTNEEMRQSKGKWWVLPKNGGEWLLFAGNLEKDTFVK